mmetsp:Transcript_24132/g.69623  ORF Transcript_24132/g.69623 Transcript_24132/m.69623 type:complete len:215 (+) Transcript_24132:527-1171(+)
MHRDPHISHAEGSLQNDCYFFIQTNTQRGRQDISTRAPHRTRHTAPDTHAHTRMDVHTHRREGTPTAQHAIHLDSGETQMRRISPAVSAANDPRIHIHRHTNIRTHTHTSGAGKRRWAMSAHSLHTENLQLVSCEVPTAPQHVIGATKNRVMIQSPHIALRHRHTPAHTVEVGALADVITRPTIAIAQPQAADSHSRVSSGHKPPPRRHQDNLL